jgi:hypothetical protein
MADKSFGVKQINLIGASGVPTVESPTDLNLNANKVAISTDVSVGRNLNVTGIATATKFIITDGSSSGFLKANGDIDTNTYLTVSTTLTLDSVTTNGNTTTNNISVGNISAGIVTATDFNSTSDVTKKYNIFPIEDSLNIISNLEGVRFNWIENGNPSIGVIAQQIEKYLPELVSSGEHKTVNYNGLVGILIEAVKELKSEVEELKKNQNN